MLGVTCTPVTSTYGIYQPQFFRFPPMQQPYTPYAYYDSYRVIKTLFLIHYYIFDIENYANNSNVMK